MKIRSYLVQHHRWVIGICVPLVTAILIAYVQIIASKPLLTNQYYYTPKSITGNLASIPKADCQEPNSVNRNDAFRCFVGDHIYDPCFANVDGTYVVCPDTPYGKEQVYALHRTDKAYERTQFDIRPWYIILTSGQECRFITGATASVAGGRLDYGCTQRGDYLVLPIEHSGDLLKIKCYNDKTKRVEYCAIKEAWF